MADQNTILVPIDFSEQSIITLVQSYNLAREINAKITLVNVTEDYGLFNKYISKKEQTEMKKNIEEKLNQLAEEKSKESGIKINTITAKGKIYAKIVEVADMINATFIMMGTSGSMGIMKFIGSNTLRVVRESKIPVISIKGKRHREGCKNIVLPLDLTKETREKVSKAIWLSGFYSEAVIRILSVSTSTDKYILNRHFRQLKQVKDFIDKKGVECTAETVKKDGRSLVQCILDYANEVEADLIMIMTQQETDITDMFIGSAAQGIINNSEIPVMSIVPVPKKYVL
ncbi:universal stress protein [bacterium AH-315-M05]|nr:universal stress protein [bacterium AH-315-M05]